MDESILYRLKNLIDQNLISVEKPQFKIGRATTNDLAIENNRYISSLHCTFEFHNGHVFIRDTSSNGTLINRTKKINKNETPMELHSGDIIHLVFRKDEPKSNVIYQLDLPKTEQKLKRKLSESKEILDKTNSNSDMELKRLKLNESLSNQAGDEMENILTCVCCQDIMTNPICLEPCLHALCDGCYSSWEVIQRTCPHCRVKVTGKKKNVVINGILEAFFKAYPEKRPVLQAIDNKNSKVKGPISTNNQDTIIDDEDEDDDDDDDDNESDEDDDDEMDEEEEEEGGPFSLAMSTPVPDARFICRQCPSNGFVNRTTTTGADFQCRPGQKHILCQCCVQPMPDRQDEVNIHQSCGVCRQHFCNLYFQQCRQPNCQGCLNQLRNFNFSPRHLTNYVNDNPVETQIVQNYLAKHRLSLRDFLLHCCQRLDRKEFTSTHIDPTTPVPSNKIVCYKCGLNIFKELAYQFRASMKKSDILPVVLRNRDDCYYGKQCRTQYTKPGHAQKLNHACVQTKF